MTPPLDDCDVRQPSRPHSSAEAKGLEPAACFEYTGWPVWSWRWSAVTGEAIPPRGGSFGHQSSLDSASALLLGPEINVAIGLESATRARAVRSSARRCSR